MSKENKMKDFDIDKVVLSVGGTTEELERGIKLLKLLTGMKACKAESKKRIPALGVRPGLEVGCKVTLRREKAKELLKRLLETNNNQLKEKQINDETFSFGIKEYIEIPKVEYQRDIGIIGFNVSVSFKRKGKRVILRKLKKGKLPKRHKVTKAEIIKFMQEKFNINMIGGKHDRE